MGRLPRSDVKLDLEGGVRVCQVEEEGRTLSALGTVCAKADNVRIPGFRERQVSRVFGQEVAEWRWRGRLGPAHEEPEGQDKELRPKDSGGR